MMIFLPVFSSSARMSRTEAADRSIRLDEFDVEANLIA